MTEYCVRCDQPDDKVNMRALCRPGDEDDPSLWIHPECWTEHLKQVLERAGRTVVENAAAAIATERSSSIPDLAKIAVQKRWEKMGESFRQILSSRKP